MLFCRSAVRAAWELAGEGESLCSGCQGGATRCGKFWQWIFASQGGYGSAKLVLADELFFAICCRGAAVFVAPLPGGGISLGGPRGAGKLGEVRRVLREPTPPSRRGSLIGLCAVAGISVGEKKYVVVEVSVFDCGSRVERVPAPMVALLAVFARRGVTGARIRPAWVVLAP